MEGYSSKRDKVYLVEKESDCLSLETRKTAKRLSNITPKSLIFWLIVQKNSNIEISNKVVLVKFK